MIWSRGKEWKAGSAQQGGQNQGTRMGMVEGHVERALGARCAPLGLTSPLR